MNQILKIGNITADLVTHNMYNRKNIRECSNKSARFMIWHLS